MIKRKQQLKSVDRFFFIDGHANLNARAPAQQKKSENLQFEQILQKIKKVNLGGFDSMQIDTADQNVVTQQGVER